MLTSHGKCGVRWTQRGNSTSHCAECHLTFATLSLFEKHRRGGVCFSPGPDLVADDEGVWWTPEGLSNLSRLQDEGRKRFKKGDDDE